MTYHEVAALLKQEGDFKVATPHLIRPFSGGGLTRDGIYILKLWLENAQVEVEDIPIIARIIRYAKEKGEIAMSKIVPRKTDLVVEKAVNYEPLLARYGVKIKTKRGGLSLVSVDRKTDQVTN